MKQFLLARWRGIALILLCIGIGILLTQLCTRKPVVTNFHESIDSLQIANKVNSKRFKALTDSVRQVVEQKEKVVTALSGKLRAIEYKYVLLRNSKPNIDTVVKYRDFLKGQEAIEKVPILQAQVQVLQSENGDLKNLVKIKTDQNNSLQGQYDRAITITQVQEKENKKLKRKAKWLKVGIISETIVVFGGLVCLIAHP